MRFWAWFTGDRRWRWRRWRWRRWRRRSCLRFWLRLRLIRLLDQLDIVGWREKR
jgi:hypothetical protein